MKCQSKEEGKDQERSYNQVPHLIKNTVWESDKNTRKHHIQESQEVKPYIVTKLAKNNEISVGL